MDMAVQKVRCRNTLLTFELDFNEFEPSTLRAHHEHALFIREDRARREFYRHIDRRSQDLYPVCNQLLALKKSVCARPRLKTPPSIPYLRCRKICKIHPSIFTRQQWRHGRLGMVLRLGSNAPALKPGQGLDNKRRTICREHFKQIWCRLLGIDLDFALQQNRP